MYFKSKPRRHALKRAIVVAAVLFAAVCWFTQHRVPSVKAQSQAGNFKSFESPQTHPLAMTPDGTRLLAVNTPNHTLSVFYLTGGALTLTAEIPVGLEPVSVAARNEREAWVVNWLSDSVSVVDLKNGNVTRTFDVGDEPTDVVFAGGRGELAFVCVSGLSQVKVFDPNAPTVAPQIISIRGKQPRALTRDATGVQVFVSVFESGNNTTVVPFRQVKQAGGAPPPNPAISSALAAAPDNALIVKYNGANWVDERGDGRWTQFIPFTLADVDVTVIDASGATPKMSREIRGVGTSIGNSVFDETTNQLYVANLEAHNEIRFEPNLRGRFADNRVSIISLNGNNPRVTPVDLNSHVNFNNTAGTDDERTKSLAMPADIVRGADGTFYVAATSSAKVGVLDASGNVQRRIDVGAGPTGLAFDAARNKLYVLNRFDDTISSVDLTTQTQTANVKVGFNPEPDQIKRGRRFLYDASLSSHGTVSCASCHLNAHRDGLAWDLGDPQGQMQQVDNGLSGALGNLLGIVLGGRVSPTSTFHPMKGPMTTQSLRGINATAEPLHWRGDRAGIENFNPAFVSLLGGGRQLNDVEMADFQSFISSLAYPPNPNQNLDRTLPNPTTGASAARGQQIFTNNLTDQRVLTCNQCHTAPPSIGTNKLIIPATALQESQDIKVPQLRGLYQKFGMKNAAGEQLSGFGFTHDGSSDNLFDFLHNAVFTFKDDTERRDVEQFVLAFDTGTAPAVGLALTINADNKTSQAANRLNLLMAQADKGNCELVARGIYNGQTRGFLYTGNGMFQPDRASEPLIASQTLLQSATKSAEITFVGVPVGAGRRIAIERTSGTLNGDVSPRPNAIDDAAFFVAEHYSDFLNREPDAAGLNFWTNQIATCNGNAQCIDLKRQNVSAAYFLSVEFQQTGYLVYRFYQSAFGRQPRYQEFTPDTRAIGNGVIVNGDNWQAKLEANKQNFVANFIARDAFRAKYPDTLNATQFVDSLNANAGNVLSQSERDALIANLTNGTETRAGALRNIAENKTFADKEFNRAFVLMQYFGYLRRNPDDAPDANLDGYNFWLNKLNSFGGDYIKAEMVRSFIVSQEYRRRFGQG